MRKLLNPKDILLLGLGHALDAFEEIKDPLGIVSFSYKSMYGWIPRRYKRHNFNQLVSRSLKAELIEKVEKNGEVFIRITSGGRKAIQRDFPMLSFQNKSWDSKWRIVMFDIEEINKMIRNQLRRKLKELGFGMLQKSVFISPHDIMKDFLEFSESAGIKGYLYLLETENLTVGDKTEFANKVWKLDKLNESYKNIVDEIEKIKNKYIIDRDDRTKKLYIQNGKNGGKNDIRMEKNNDSRMEKNIEKVIDRKIRNKWLNIAVYDPFLPRALLPKPWWGYEAGRLVKNLAT